MQGMLQLDALSKTYGSTQALRSLTLSIAEGKTVALIGSSGCGKSTLLRILAGLVTPDEGQVTWRDEPITAERLRAWRLRLGYVIQEGGLFPHLTLAENVTLVANQIKWTESRKSARMQELAELTHLPRELLDRYPAQVSGGQRQRVALMRALFLDPDVLLLDEPLGALDPLIRAELQQDLRDIFQRLRKTVLLVTHDVAEAEVLADEVVLLQQGRIAQQGLIQEMRSTPANDFVERFLRSQNTTVAPPAGESPV